MKINDYGYQIKIHTYQTYDGYVDENLAFNAEAYRQYCQDHREYIIAVSILIHGKEYNGKRFWQNVILEDYFRYHRANVIVPFAILEKLLYEHRHYPEY